jgi:hypothetical protein
MSILDALLNRKTVQPSSAPNPNAATTGQIVPVAFITEPRSELSSGSDLNRASSGWPALLDSLNAKLVNGGWVPSKLREVEAHNEIGNYGMVSSKANWLFRYRAFGGIGNMPGPVPNPYRPMWQELTPITWRTLVPNANIAGTTTEQHGPIVIQTQPSTWQGANTASLMKTGEVLL